MGEQDYMWKSKGLDIPKARSTAWINDLHQTESWITSAAVKSVPPVKKAPEDILIRLTVSLAAAGARLMQKSMY